MSPKKKTSPFDKLREKETPTRSFRWYQDNIRQLGLGTLQPAQVMRTDIGEFVTNIVIGDMYLYKYDPKLKEELPYYDTFPLTVVFRKVQGGFLGLNLHYLPPMLRMKLLGRLLEYTNDKTLSETTKFKLKWALLNNAARFPGVHACVKRYLYSHVQTRLMRIHPQDWKKAIMLPIDNFKKASRNKVYKDSRGMI